MLAGFQVPDPLPIQQAQAAPLVAGIVVAHVVAFAAFVALFQLAREQATDADVAARSVLYTALYPWAYHYATPYTEGLFLLATVTAFLALRHRRWLLAGIFIVLASATRAVGVLLVGALVVELVIAWRDGRLPRAARPAALGGLLIAPLGLLTYMGYLWWRFGDALSFAHAQEDWGRQATLPTTTILRGLNYALHRGWTSAPDIYARGIIHGLFALAFLAVIIVSARRWPLSWLLYGALLSIAVLSSPVGGSYTLHDMGRHLMVFFPVYIALGRWGRHRTVNLAILMLFVPLFSLFAAFYVRWHAA